MARSKIDVEVLKTMYSDGVSTKDIAAHFGVTDRGVRDRLTKLGINEGYKRMARKYAINEAFFDVWSDAMAYTLGFILTDGCVDKRGNVFSIAQKDRAPLDAIKRYMQADHPIVKRNTRDIHTLHIGSKRMVDALARLGISSNKSLTVALPDVPDAYMPAFLLGVIDGDGYVHPKGYVVVITTGSGTFAEQMAGRLSALGHTFKVTQDSGVHRVKLSGKTQVKALASYLYAHNPGYCLAYKRERLAQS